MVTMSVMGRTAICAARKSETRVNITTSDAEPIANRILEESLK
jgi:hypothetical protein